MRSAALPAHGHDVLLDVHVARGAEAEGRAGVVAWGRAAGRTCGACRAARGAADDITARGRARLAPADAPHRVQTGDPAPTARGAARRRAGPATTAAGGIGRRARVALRAAARPAHLLAGARTAPRHDAHSTSIGAEGSYERGAGGGGDSGAHDPERPAARHRRCQLPRKALEPVAHRTSSRMVQSQRTGTMCSLTFTSLGTAKHNAFTIGPEGGGHPDVHAVPAGQQ